jgi:hypothetical protein
MSEQTNTPTTTTSTTELAEKLEQAGKKAVQEQAQRREREVKGSHLLPALLDMVKAVSTLSVAEKTGFQKVTGTAKGKAVYVAKKGGRVDLSGFEVALPNAAIKVISEQAAKDQHLGRVRGQLDFGRPDADVLEAFSAALAQLDVATPMAPKPPRVPKAPRAPKAPKAAAAPAATPASTTTATESVKTGGAPVTAEA